MDNIFYNSMTKLFAEPPDMDLPIDKYFTKKEECRLLASDSDNPITDATMVLQLTTHMSATGWGCLSRSREAGIPLVL